MKIEWFCQECGGTNVRSQNWSMWNTETQRWEITETLEMSAIDIDFVFRHQPGRCKDWCDDCDEVLSKNLGKRTSMRGGKVRLMQEIKSE